MKGVVSHCPTALQNELREPLDVLLEGVGELATSYQPPISSLILRPALILMGFIASSSYLLEHAIWSCSNVEAEHDTDVEVFRRWALEGGMMMVIADVRCAKSNTDRRLRTNYSLVFGGSSTPKAKL